MIPGTWSRSVLLDSVDLERLLTRVALTIRNRAVSIALAIS